MPQPQRVAIEQVVTAYKETGSIWRAAKNLGVCGQSVWERLRAIGYSMGSQRWTADELEELKTLAQQGCTIGEIGRRLGRPYAAIACKMSRIGTPSQRPRPIKIPRGLGYDQKTIHRTVGQLAKFSGSLRQFCRQNSYEIEMLVQAIQRYEPAFWDQYTSAHSEIPRASCPNCSRTFYPMSKKQVSCTRKCAEDARRDKAYFGGQRRNTVGLAEGICQLCGQPKERLSSHHVFGKQNDPNNEYLVALCSGCHHLVGMLAGRNFVDDSSGWENLVHLVMMRRLAEKRKEYAGVYACVEFEYLTQEQWEEQISEGSTEDHPTPAHYESALSDLPF